MCTRKQENRMECPYFFVCFFCFLLFLVPHELHRLASTRSIPMFIIVIIVIIIIILFACEVVRHKFEMPKCSKICQKFNPIIIFLRTVSSSCFVCVAFLALYVFRFFLSFISSFSFVLPLFFLPIDWTIRGDMLYDRTNNEQIYIYVCVCVWVCR